MRISVPLIAVVASLMVAEASAQELVNPSKPGDVFIDHHGSTVQLTECRVSGPTTECQVRVLKQASGGASYGSIWWTLDNLRDSERVGVRLGNAPYSGPTVPLPGVTASNVPTPSVSQSPVARSAVPNGQVAAAGGRCTPATSYTGAISASRAPSAALFREIIANKFTVDGTPQYPRKVDYLSFSVSAPTTNTVGMTNQGANRLTNGAPAGAQLYPIKASFTVCKSEWTKISRYDSAYFCWRVGGEWACGVSESRVN